jgi:hypothetical protein
MSPRYHTWGLLTVPEKQLANITEVSADKNEE